MSCHSTHMGIAATQHAKAITNLDDTQVSGIFHRLKNTHTDAPAPTPDEAIATLTRLRREVLDDRRLPPATASRIADRYLRGIDSITNGELPDGRTWAAMQATPVEAEIAETNLRHALQAAATHQRTTTERLTARFDQWRKNANYEDVEAPDPAFRPDPSDFPADKHTQRALRKLGWENYLHQPLPVFTYGTLRNGQGNDRLMNGAIASRSEEAQVDGIAIYGADRGFPYAQEAPDGTGITRGDIVYLTDDAHGHSARGRLDNLEGFNSDGPSNSHYRRVALDVTYTDPESGQQHTTKAWTYLAGSWAQRDLREEDRIHDGDWVKARDAYRAAPRQHASESIHPGYTSGFRVIRASTDPQPASRADRTATSAPATSTSAAASASVFENAGLLDEEPDDNAGFWSQHR